MLVILILFIFCLSLGQYATCGFAQIVAGDGLSLERLFREKGAGVLQNESVARRGRDALMGSLLQSGNVVGSPAELTMPKDDFYFTPILPDLFPNVTLPPFAAYMFVAKASVDIEICFSKEIPCSPSAFAAVELEELQIPRKSAFGCAMQS
jgi:hypothetical protein